LAFKDQVGNFHGLESLSICQMMTGSQLIEALNM